MVIFHGNRSFLFLIHKKKTDDCSSKLSLKKFLKLHFPLQKFYQYNYFLFSCLHSAFMNIFSTFFQICNGKKKEGRYLSKNKPYFEDWTVSCISKLLLNLLKLYHKPYRNTVKWSVSILIITQFLLIFHANSVLEQS